MPREHDKLGFTLLEILVAMTIAAIVLGALYGAYAAATGSVTLYRGRLKIYQRLWSVAHRIADDLSAAYIHATEREERPDKTKSALALEEQPPSFSGMGLATRAPELLFLTSRGGKVSPDHPVADAPSIVGYALDETRGILLHRRAPAFSEDAHKREDWRALLRGVTQFAVKFHDGEEWREEWDSKEQGGLPRAVWFRLVVSDDEGREYSVATAVPIFSASAQPGKQTIEVKREPPPRK